MPALNYDKGKGSKAVAVVRGGDDDGRVLYLHPDLKTGSGSKTVDAVSHMKQLNFLKPAERVRVMSEIAEHVEKDTDPAAFLPTGGDDRVSEAYKKIKTATNANTTILLPDDSMFMPIPDPDPKVRQIWYVAGISGSGKSYFARNIAENYKKLFPEREIYLVSKYPVDEDDTLGKMKIGKPKSISLDSIVEDYPSIDEFENCLIIFDDYDTLAAPYDKVVQKLIDDLAIRGRHTATSMCVLSHYLTNYKKTRLILGESHFIVLYPMATSFKAMKYVCEHHCGLTKDEVQSLKKLGRWVCLHKVFPQYLISTQTARLLNQ
jgi:hypothetical protein